MSRALVVDDEFGIRHIVKLALSRLKIEVLEAATAKAAMASLETLVPDLVLMDLRLPDQSGLSLAQAMQAQFPFLPIVFMSASTELAQAAEQASVRAYLEKPFKLVQLQVLVEEILRERSEAGVETAP